MTATTSTCYKVTLIDFANNVTTYIIHYTKTHFLVVYEVIFYIKLAINQMEIKWNLISY